MIPVCADCRFFEVRWKTRDGATTEDSEGTCHAQPPRHSIMQRHSDHNWPVVAASDWCGMWDKLE